MDFEVDQKSAAISLTIMHVPIFSLFGIFFSLFIPEPIIGRFILDNGLFLGYIVPFIVYMLCCMVFASPWISKIQAKELEYSLDNGVLTAKGGVIFKKVSSIPIEKVTDVVLFSNPIQNLFHIWTVKVQTAGSGQRAAEISLLGLKSPEAARNEIIEAIQFYRK